MKNETGRPPERPATNSITCADDSRASGERPRLIRVYAPRPPKRLRVPTLVLELPYEGNLTVGIRGAGSERGAKHMRAWLEADDEVRELCRLARSIRDRRAA